MSTSSASHPPLWLCRPLGLGLALMTAKTVMLAGRSDLPLTDPLAIPALMHDHLLVVALFLMLDLLVQLRSRPGGPEVEAVGNRAMWCLLGLALLWVGASVPIAAALGAPSSLSEIRQGGGTLAVLLAGATPASVLGALLAMGVGITGPIVLRRAARRRVLSVALTVAILITVVGPIGRETLDLDGLERDPFAVIIQATWQGLQTVAGP
jgi:hypothetical protein